VWQPNCFSVNLSDLLTTAEQFSDVRSKFTVISVTVITVVKYDDDYDDTRSRISNGTVLWQDSAV